MTSATERLRAMLDERGVEWQGKPKLIISGIEKGTEFDAADGRLVRAVEALDGTICLSHITPEQAIAATLGAGTCHVECFDDGIDEALDGSPIYTTPTWHLSCGHTEQGSERPSFCPVCGKAVVA